MINWLNINFPDYNSCKQKNNIANIAFHKHIKDEYIDSKFINKKTTQVVNSSNLAQVENSMMVFLESTEEKTLLKPWYKKVHAYLCDKLYLSNEIIKQPLILNYHIYLMNSKNCKINIQPYVSNHFYDANKVPLCECYSSHKGVLSCNMINQFQTLQDLKKNNEKISDYNEKLDQKLSKLRYIYEPSSLRDHSQI